ncbi:GNAT family N-acetyltransferase [Paucilactobacillus oligofermentans DSM 15707 = LMG 22743]|uniref:GNAT family N-acetyltransferase n=1 Tax=Paucilactobacillus oligofermentans DSM 15707 = LMG 22743 TaxID=1423778 RepID=A0A0R1RGF5_9LACO|nr:GNAT family N-acetyltransferase [Paucilactobacillus oligofermentans]KRL55951.1 GNAT family N-acetyltransferase [Paucilactobacillus oligofermentans DSM 15707 = LMG 22743]CUS26067.1 Possible histone acetyltransferase [Paucilactobacillus oligofermentans DSM 15707 = LMG 22743]
MIRKAQPADAKMVAPLIYTVLEDMELDLILKVDKKDWIKVLEKAFKVDDHRYSYQNAFVNEYEGTVAGVAFGYPEEMEAGIDEAFDEFLIELGLPQDVQLFNDKEAYPNEWYLDTLSVNPDFQGLGVGTQLLEMLPTFVKTMEINKIGLNVDEQNGRAEKLYRKIGYQKVGSLTLGTHPYSHLQLEI